MSIGLDALSRMGGLNQEMMNVPIQLSASLNDQFQKYDNTFASSKDWIDEVKKDTDGKWTNWGEL